MISHSHDVEDMHNRLLKLERQNRSLKRVGVAALIIVVSALVLASTPQKKTVEANEFVLKDTSGTVRARLSMNANPNPELLFFDEREGRCWNWMVV